MLDLRNCDNMKLMAEFPDNHFELAIVDPPYGIIDKIVGGGESGRKMKLRKELLKWDCKPDKSYFDELKRVSKNQIIWGSNYFPENISHSRGWIVWDKIVPEVFSYAKGELAWTSFNRNLEIIRMTYCGEKIPGRVYNKMHPTEKPVKLYKWLLENYAKPGDKILDTHLGSGSIAIACHYLGFDLTGCELDSDYFEAMQKRIKEETAQVSLF